MNIKYQEVTMSKSSTTPLLINKKFKGEPCIELYCGKYTALVAPRIGANILRLHDNINKLELINYSYKVPMKFLRWPSLVHGMPSLLYPNRIAKGVFTTSHTTYNLPINTKWEDNYLHGFLHTRKYSVESVDTNKSDNSATVTCKYVYNEKDEFFKHFPLAFTSYITYTLSPDGLHYSMEIVNNSDKPLPVGLGNHTGFKAPFFRKGKKENLRIEFPAVKRVEIKDNLCTGAFLPLSHYDKGYTNGSMQPVLHDVDNEMYLLDKMDTPAKENFHGIVISDVVTGYQIYNEYSEEYPFVNLWNCGGKNDFFCVEPMTWMIDAPNIKEPGYITGYREIAPGESFSAWQRLFSYVAK